MKKVACIVLSALLLTSCSNAPKGGTAGLPDVNPSPAGPPGVAYSAPSSTAKSAPVQQYTYVFPDSQNACAPAPQRFVAASGAITFRVKNCAKDEYDYLPEGNQSRIDALMEQCRATCPASAPAPTTSTN